VRKPSTNSISTFTQSSSRQAFIPGQNAEHFFFFEIRERRKKRRKREGEGTKGKKKKEKRGPPNILHVN
jgi:hypothetical protein